jgi:hypothetical protein
MWVSVDGEGSVSMRVTICNAAARSHVSEAVEQCVPQVRNSVRSASRETMRKGDG